MLKIEEEIKRLTAEKRACEKMFEKTGNKKWLLQARAFEELIEKERSKLQ